MPCELPLACNEVVFNSKPPDVLSAQFPPSVVVPLQALTVAAAIENLTCSSDAETEVNVNSASLTRHSLVPSQIVTPTLSPRAVVLNPDSASVRVKDNVGDASDR